MEKEKISVIIPVYNSEKYVEKCVETVCGQSYENLEIILVNDGSTDGCPAICDMLAEKDSRIKVIHKENGGASSARNAGLDIATGRYIGFIDSDDYIELDMYEKLYNALVEADADLSVCDFTYVDGEGNSLATIPPLPAGVRDSRQAFELVEFGEEAWRYITLVNRLYKRELFDHYRLEEGKICEDEFAAHPIYAQCKRIVFISDVLYWDVKRENSVMISPVSVNRLAGVEARLQRYDFYRRQGWRKMSHSAAWRAYGTAWLVVKNVNAWEYRDEIKPSVLQVSRKLLQCGDIMRAVALIGMYWCAERKGKAESRKNAAA